MTWQTQANPGGLKQTQLSFFFFPILLWFVFLWFLFLWFVFFPLYFIFLSFLFYNSFFLHNSFFIIPFFMIRFFSLQTNTALFICLSVLLSFTFFFFSLLLLHEFTQFISLLAHPSPINLILLKVLITIQLHRANQGDSTLAVDGEKL